MNKKNWVITIVVVIVIIVIAVIVGNTNTAKAPENSSSTTIASTTVSTTTPVSSSTTSATSSGLTVTEVGFYGNKNYSLSYPNTWTISTYSPFSMTNFKGKYQSSGAIPPGGAEVDVVTTTISGTSKDIMMTELMSATKLTTSAVTINNVVCARADYENTYTSGVASRDVAIYCQRGTELWKIYLSYRADDSTAAMHIADFNGVLASMKLL